MKLLKIIIGLIDDLVECQCVIEVQGSVFPVAFTLKESDIYAKAADEGRDSWENSDLIAVAKDKLNLDVSI